MRKSTIFKILTLVVILSSVIAQQTTGPQTAPLTNVPGLYLDRVQLWTPTSQATGPGTYNFTKNWRYALPAVLNSGLTLADFTHDRTKYLSYKVVMTTSLTEGNISLQISPTVGSINYMAFSVIVITDRSYVDMARAERTGITVTSESTYMVAYSNFKYYAATTTYFCLIEWITAATAFTTSPPASYYDRCQVSPTLEGSTRFRVYFYTSNQVWLTATSAILLFIRSQNPAEPNPTYNILNQHLTIGSFVQNADITTTDLGVNTAYYGSPISGVNCLMGYSNLEVALASSGTVQNFLNFDISTDQTDGSKSITQVRTSGIVGGTVLNIYCYGQCMLNCDICLTSTTCSKCSEGYLKRDDNLCYLDCVKGTYQEDRQCKPCDSKCLACTSLEACTECKTNEFFRDDNFCYATCLDTTYADTTTGKCEPCDDTCLHCKTQSTTCTKCHDGFYLSGDKCVACDDSCTTCDSGSACLTCPEDKYINPNQFCYTDCPDGLYEGVVTTTVDGAEVSTKTCLACDSNCKTCGTTAVECLSCNDATFTVNPNTKVCDPCHDSCLTCQNGDSCLTCPDKHFHMPDEYCYAECPQTFYGECSTMECKPCDDSCQTCSRSDQCDTCKAGLRRNWHTNLCDICHETCKTCTTAQSCDTCPDAKPLKKEGEFCYDACPSGTYISGTDCLICPASCATCTSDSACQSCAENYYLNEDLSTCVAECPEGFYADTLTQKCTACLDNCQVCDKAATCTTCKATFLLSVDKSTCTASCTDGQYDLDGTNCASCKPECSTCSDADTCDTCVGKFVAPDGKCYDACPAKTYQSDATTCSACLQLCATCADGTTCISCVAENDFVDTADSTCKDCDASCKTCSGPAETECKSCPDKFFLKKDDNTCVACQNSCATCASDTICLSCPDGTFLLRGSTCQADCPEGFFKNTQTLTCDGCHASCKTCTSSGTCDSSGDVCRTGDFLIDNENYCSSCDPGCLTCGTSPKTCVSCRDGYFVNPDTKYCDKCLTTCLTCLNPTQCVSCPSGSYLDDSNQCQTCDLTKCVTCQTTATTCTSCASTSYLDTGSNTCIACDSKCKTCQQTSTKCTSCNEPMILNNFQCSNCPEGSFQNTDGNCQKCKVGCKSCADANDCIDCDAVLDHRTMDTDGVTCIPMDGYYESNVQAAAPCPLQCQKCSSLTVCSACKENYYLTSANKCQPQCSDSGTPCTCDPTSNCQTCSPSASGPSATCINCPSDRFLTVSNTCDLCDSTCKTCKDSSTKCTSCIDGKFVNVLDQCQDCHIKCATCSAYSTCLTCSAGHYQDSTGQCVSCADPCKNCAGTATTCTSCVDPTLHVAYGTCKKCAQREFDDAGTCTACHFSCFSCTDTSATGCLTCNKDDNRTQYYNSGKCQPMLGYFESGVTKAGACSTGCLKCQSSSVCTACSDSFYYLQDGACHPKCTYPSGAFCACPIDSSCKTCETNGICTSCQGKQVTNGHCNGQSSRTAPFIPPQTKTTNTPTPTPTQNLQNSQPDSTPPPVQASPTAGCPSNCRSCSTPSLCDECMSGFELQPSTGKCQRFGWTASLPTSAVVIPTLLISLAVIAAALIVIKCQREDKPHKDEERNGTKTCQAMFKSEMIDVQADKRSQTEKERNEFFKNA